MNASRPIRFLYDAIIDSFYNSNPLAKNRLDELAKEHKVYPGIIFNFSTGGMKTPVVGLETKKIEIHESHLCFLWILTFNFLEMNESARQKDLSGTRTRNFNMSSLSDPMMVEDMFNWAFSLKNNYTAWPDDFPKPTDPHQKIQIVNLVFIKIINYLMYHEIAHLANGHISYIDIIKIKDQYLEGNQKDLIKQLELEADNYALEMLRGEGGDELELHNNAVASILGNISNLFIINGISGLKGSRHQDIDTRLFNLKNSLVFENALYKLNIDQIIATGIKLFLLINKLPFQDLPFTRAMRWLVKHRQKFTSLPTEKP